MHIERESINRGLSGEVLLKVFSYLDYSDLGRLQQVCRRYADVAKDNTLWKDKYIKLGGEFQEVVNNGYFYAVRAMFIVRQAYRQYDAADKVFKELRISIRDEGGRDSFRDMSERIPFLAENHYRQHLRVGYELKVRIALKPGVSQVEEYLSQDKHVLEKVRLCGLALAYASDSLKENRDFALKYVERGEGLQFAHRDLLSDQEIVLKAVKRNGLALQYVSDELRGDFDIVYVAARSNGHSYQYASANYKTDRDMVLQILSLADQQGPDAHYNNAAAFKHVSDQLRNDKEFVLKALEVNPVIYPFVGDRIREELLETASGLLRNLEPDDITQLIQLEGLPFEIRDCKALMLSLAGHWLLSHVSLRLRNDPEVVRAFVCQGGFNIRHALDCMKYASEYLKDDKAFVLSLLADRHPVYESVSDRLRNDPDVVRAAQINDVSFFSRCAPEHLKDDKRFVLSLLADGHMVYESVSDRLRNDPDVTRAAVSQASYYMRSASVALKDDKQFILNLLADGYGALGYGLLGFVSERLQNDPEVVKAAVLALSSQMDYASIARKKDRQLIRGLAKSGGLKGLFVLDANLDQNHWLGVVDPEVTQDKWFMLELALYNKTCASIIGSQIYQSSSFLLGVGVLRLLIALLVLSLSVLAMQGVVTLFGTKLGIDIIMGGAIVAQWLYFRTEPPFKSGKWALETGLCLLCYRSSLLLVAFLYPWAYVAAGVVLEPFLTYSLKDRAGQVYRRCAEFSGWKEAKQPKVADVDLEPCGVLLGEKQGKPVVA